MTNRDREANELLARLTAENPRMVVNVWLTDDGELGHEILPLPETVIEGEFRHLSPQNTLDAPHER